MKLEISLSTPSIFVSHNKRWNEIRAQATRIMDFSWAFFYASVALGLWVSSLSSAVVASSSLLVKMNEDMTSQWHNCSHAKQQIEVKITFLK